MLRLFWRRAFAALFLLVIVSCAGGGGCAGCGAEPIAGGFPRDSVIQNAASVRITRPGLDFLAANLPKVVQTILKNNGTLSFDIPKTDQSASFGSGIFSIDFNAHICPNGANHTSNPPTCVVDVNIGDAKMKLDSITPHAIRISGTLPVRLKDLPITVDNTGPDLGDMDVGLGMGQCNGGTPAYDYKAFPVEIVIPIINGTLAPRDGFSFLDVNNAVIDPKVTKDDVDICKSCGFATGICNGFFDFVKGLVFNSVIGGIKTKLKDTLKSQLCTKPDTALTPQCPIGSSVSSDKSQCVFTAKPDTCMPIALGTDGHIDLSGALASISPGTAGGFNYILAAGGDMDPAPALAADNVGYAGHTPNGITLPMLGGALPLPQSSCVPLFKNIPPTGIPIPDELRKDKQAPWPATDPNGPDVGIALSGRFLDYAFGSVYNSGLLCLGVSTEQFQQLQSGLISALIPSLKNLTFEQKASPVAITTRPQVPPKVKLGTGKDIKTDPLLTIDLKSFAVDFYVWSMDRYVRVFTFTGDLTIPVNLQTAKDPKTNPDGGLLPVIGEISITNQVVTNADLLTDDPKLIGDSLASILGGLSSQLTGGLKPIDLSSAFKSFGLALTVPDGGIRKLTKGTDDFLGIFANLGLAQNANVEADTQVKIVGKTVHPEAMSLVTARRELLPELHVLFSSPMDGAHAVEYAWSFDQGSRSAWSKDRDVTIKNDYLFFQGKHTLHAWARIAGEQLTEDSTPADAPFTIDTLPPNVELASGKSSGETTLKAWDFVSDESALQVRLKTTDASGSNEASAFGPWMSLAEANAALLRFPATTLNVDVEVRDEEGNVGTTSSALIRGKPDASLAAGGGCGCSTPGTSSVPGGWALLGGVAGLFAFGWRRRVQRARQSAAAVGLGTVCVIAATTQGCDCGDGSGNQNQVGCGTDCKQPCHGALPMGMVGAYTSIATAKDGTIWVAGYNDAALSNDGNFLYGDLVVGKYDGAKQLVAWETVDGTFVRTDGSCPESDRSGWRNGETESGDDVGLWTSIQLDADDHPIVSYYDATNKVLKFAFFDGHWSSYAVLGAPGADIGRYSKMRLVGGNPVIAFAVLEKGNGGALRSKVSLAKASSKTPRGPGDWAIEDIAVDETGPCRAFTCDGSDVCVKSTGTCLPTIGGCTPADCGANNACVTLAGKATCTATLPASYIEGYPNAIGDYISMADGPQGLGIVAYDRVHGNLVGYSNTGGAWAATILAGETGSRPAKNAVDTGDTGVGASLAITSNGDWHVTYVNGVSETLNYVLVPGGKTPLKPEVIDDGAGYGVGAAPFADGRHIVGDDSHVTVLDGGAVTVVYQDATVGELRVATGSPTGQTHAWTVKGVPQPNRFAGYFPHPVPASQQVINWWRATDHATKAITGDVSFVTP
jgi:MYXO-CTERM domain-containing protein